MATADYHAHPYVRQLNEWHLELAMLRDLVDHILGEVEALAECPDVALGFVPGRNDPAQDVEHLLRRSGRRIAGGRQAATGNTLRNKVSQCASKRVVGRGGVGFWAGHFGKEVGGRLSGTKAHLRIGAPP